MYTGKLVEFDPEKGCGYIEPEGGASRVFVYADDFNGMWDLRPGLTVRFSSLHGSNGLRAYNALVVTDPSDHAPNEIEPMTYHMYAKEITETLLTKAPGISAAQIAQVCKKLTKRAAKRGWLKRADQYEPSR
jgi:CspA family cold shock protein